METDPRLGDIREGTDDECCGACKYFAYEDVDGWGWCQCKKNPYSLSTPYMFCGDVCDNFKAHGK